MLEFLNLEQWTTLQMALAVVGLLTVFYAAVRIISWLILQIAVMIKWMIRVVVAAALSKYALEWASAKFTLPEGIRSLLL